MAEDLRKAEVKRLLWVFLTIVPATFLSFLLAYILRNYSWRYISIVFFVFWLGLFFWGLGRMGALNSDWKTLSIGRRSVWWGCTAWNISELKGLGSRKRDYLDLVAERMVKKDFKLIEEIKPDIWGQHLFKGSDLTLETPEREYKTGIRAVSIGENLRVGFNYSDAFRIFKKVFIWSVCFFVPLLACDIIPYAFPSIDTSQLEILLIIIFFVGFGLLIFIGVKKLRALDGQIKQFLVDTAESIDSKQITPFRRILVKYE